MKSIIFILLCVICLAGQVFAATPHYLQISVSGLNDSREPVCPVSLVYDISQEQILNGAYYIADSSCGITTDAAAFQPSGLEFEIAYNMKIQVDDQGTWLSGSAYALNYFGGKKRGFSERTSVEKALVKEKKTLVGSFGLQDGRDVQLFVTLFDNCPHNNTDCGKNAVTLITSVSSHGKSFAHKTQVRKLLAETMDFQSVIKPDGLEGKESTLRYATRVKIPDCIEALKKPTQCQVVFQRSYQITSSQTNGTNSQTAVSYSSQNTQGVVLEPGKELRLVFPPDKPSVEGFDIEDTLVIIPR
jgi:hypothetical protein